MPLSPLLLSAELAIVFRDKIADPLVVASKQAAAYALYARSATAALMLPAFTGLEVLKIQPILFAALATPTLGTPVNYATAWATALTAFWGLPPVPFAGLAGVGVSAPPIGAATLVPAIAAVVSNPANTAEFAAIGIALALHAATLTVIVTGTTPFGGPLSSPLL